MFRLLIPVVLVSGCSSAEALSKGEAEQVYAAINTVTNDLVVIASDLFLAPNAQARSFEMDGNSVSAKVTDGNGWTGTVSVEGSMALTDGDYVYDLGVIYDEVTVDETTLNGGMDLGLDVSGLDLTAARANLALGLGGDLDATGKATGAAALDYVVAVDIDGLNIVITAEGSLSGFDVSGWGFALPALF